MKKWFVLGWALLPWLAGAAPSLGIYWIDVEGGASTLIVTPAHESILIDTGWPQGPSAQRIYRAATNAGLSKIDYLILTHFHIDHFGGAAPLSKLIPIGVVLDNGIPDHDPDGQNNARFAQWIQPYRDFKADRREVTQPGEILPLKQMEGATPISLQCMGARQRAVHPADMGGPNPDCAGQVQHPLDTSDNANSSVWLLRFGSFKFFDGGDLTWNLEGRLVCPTNSIGHVDVYQCDHHGVNLSNNPLLVRSLAPAVTVMDNGPKKGGARETLATLRSVASIQTMFQLHRDLRGGSEFNTDAPYIANQDANCQGNDIECTVDEAGKSYTMKIPATGFSKTYLTHTAEAAQ